MARLLANAGMEAIFSYAGRTRIPAAQPLPVREGGFGGPDGLARYLRDEGITHLIDATHPFAAQMSRSAIAASKASGVELIALERPPWQSGPDDRWSHVRDIAEAAKALPQEPSRVFLAIGRQNLADFAGLPHRYLLRLVDPPDGPWPLTGADAVIARGPFTPDQDEALLRAHRITHVVSKNSGGAGAEAKLIAARRLRLAVIMIDRPELPLRPVVGSPEEVMARLHQFPSARRGV